MARARVRAAGLGLGVVGLGGIARSIWEGRRAHEGERGRKGRGDAGGL